MIVCRNCGRKNPDGTEFCQNPDCGEYLEFEGDRVATTAMPAVPAGGPPTAAAPPPTPTPPPQAPPPVSATAPTAPVGPTARPPAGRRPDGEMDADTAERARRLLARNQGPAPAQPQARPPAEAETRPPPPVYNKTETPALKPGEIACPNCGRGNGPERNFCRRCGTELRQAAPQPVPVPQPPPPNPTQMSTAPISRPPDTRPWYKRPLAIILIVLAVVLAVVLLFVVARVLMNALGGDDGGGGGGDSGSAQRELASGELRAASADGSLNQGTADRAIDGDTSTFWPGDEPTGDDPETLQIAFDETVELARIEITAGAAGDEFGGNPRPHRGFLEFSDGATFELELQDTADPQSITLPSARQVDHVAIHFVDAYDERPGGRAPITEVRFFDPTG